LIRKKGNALIRKFDKELLQIEPYGANSLRIRATQLPSFRDDALSALLPVEDCGAGTDTDININEEEDSACIRNGNITCEVLSIGKLRFLNQNGQLLLEEYDKNRFRRRNSEGIQDCALEIAPREFIPHLGTDNYRLTARFEAKEDEHLYGMGQYSQPYLNIKGCSLELSQRNSQISIPFVLSGRGYGFLWNNPAIGKATFGKNVTEWVAESSRQIDYWITAGNTPAEIVEKYADVTGKVPMMPSYASGLWQSKLRYRSQKEVLDVAREYKKRNIPLSVIVIDFFHWTAQGDWKFDPELWPDPAAMTAELHEMGIEVMVSVWPTVEEGSENFRYLEEAGYLIRTEMGPRLGIKNKDTYFDATNRDAQKFVWSRLRENYYKKGIHLFWLDECEPEVSGYEYRNYRLSAGTDLEAGNVYPKEFTKMVYEGRKQEGDENILSLCRCAWAGSQKYGALVWTGDIASDFDSLKNQIYAGMSMGLSGMPWWTTDIGGFHGGNAESAEFRECLVRWFEFAAFCPVLRMHGFREPKIISMDGRQFTAGDAGSWKYTSGSPNELWSFGEDVYRILKKYTLLRESLRPYIMEQMKAAHEKGTPVMRPLFYDYPSDRTAWETEDEYMFGPDILVSPVLEKGQTTRKVYLPEGSWINMNTKKKITGNQTLQTPAPVDIIPVFIKGNRYADLFAAESAY